MAILTNEIFVGSVLTPDIYFTNNDIKTINATLNAGIVADELAIDELTIEVYALREEQMFIPDGSDGLLTDDGDLFYTVPIRQDYSSIPFAKPIYWYVGGSLFLKFYAESVARESRDVWQINAISAIGILDKKRHFGGIYEGTTFADILTEIIGTDFSFSVAPDLASLPMYGWLPIATARDNIHQLLLAAGAALDKDASGEMYFKFLSSATTTAIADANVFYGGDISYPIPAERVEVTEHSYYKTAFDKLSTLFNNTDGATAASGKMVTFKNPCYGLYTDGNLTIDEQGANYAIVSGIGWLYGYEYSQSEEIVVAEVDDPSTAPKTVEVTDAYLVSLVNARNVAERLLDYYSSTKTINMDIVNTGEKPNDLVSFTDPFDDPAEGFISVMDVTASSFIRGGCQVIAGYTPSHEGNIFSNFLVLTGSGTWTNTTGATYGRIIVLGGGQGGYSGEKGEGGANGTSSSGGDGGDGGKAGIGGEGGKAVVYEGVLPNSAIYTCGAGGNGAGVNTTTDSEAGTLGTYTLFTGVDLPEIELDSRFGVVPSNGIYNIISGEVYAARGTSGINGAAGGAGGQTGVDAEDGADNGEMTGGAAGANEIVSSVTYGGGGGGGASADNNGAGGGNAYDDGVSGWFGGAGGNGGAGNTTMAANTVYGSGGFGGNGGGGGGGGGKGSTSANFGFGGAGGNGGCGGKGAPGAVIIFY